MNKEYLKISYTLTFTVSGECIIAYDEGKTEEEVMRMFDAIAESEPESLAPGIDVKMFKHFTEVDDDWYEYADRLEYEGAEVSFE